MRSKFKRFSPEWWDWMTVPEPNTGCRLWLGTVCKSGYGRVGYGTSGSPVLVHRIALGLALGHPISSGLKVLHRCDTPSCVNPDHLFLGSQKDNMRDMFSKGRARPHGSGTPTLQLLRSVTVRELSSKDSNASVRIVDDLHHIRTTAMVEGWRHVTGAPAIPPHHDGPSCECPRLRTALPANRDGVGFRTDATVAGCFPVAVPRLGGAGR